MTTDSNDAHLRMVRYWVNIYRKQRAFRNIDARDMFQEGCIGLMRAKCLYNVSRRTKFSGYASAWIRKYIRRLPNRGNWREEPTDASMIDDLNLSRDDTVEAAERREMRGDLATAMSGLDAPELDIVAARFGIGKRPESRAAIARRMGVTYERVRWLERKSLEKLRKNGLLRRKYR